MAERIGNLGYFGLVKEVAKGTPLVPTDFVPIYDESMDTDGQFIDQQPVYGNKAKTYNTVPGQRKHGGDVTILAEPNVTARLVDSLLTKASTAGGGPYTHVFGLSATQNPNSYTVDISLGNVVKRFWGVEASKIVPAWDKNEMRLKVSLSALGSFRSRDIATVVTTTLTLADPKGIYNGAPNKGLVVGDLVRIYKSSTGATLDTTIASVNVDGITVTLGASAAAFAAGDTIQLRPATPSFTLLDSFLWSRTRFCFGATASAALSAAHTPVENGSSFELSHDFNNDDGEMRSGSFDPAALVRKTGDANLKVKKYFDTTEDLQNFQNLTKTACVIRCYAGSTGQYELRVTLNNLKTDGKITPGIKADEVEYTELDYHINYDQSDAAAFGVTVINNLSAI
jgi:hypothetical protein